MFRTSSFQVVEVLLEEGQVRLQRSEEMQGELNVLLKVGIDPRRDPYKRLDEWIVLEWAIQELPCADAVELSDESENGTRYACFSHRSVCFNVSTADRSGYSCKCVQGHHGNPYVSDGCHGHPLSPSLLFNLNHKHNDLNYLFEFSRSTDFTEGTNNDDRYPCRSEQFHWTSFCFGHCNLSQAKIECAETEDVEGAILPPKPWPLVAETTLD